MQVLISFELLLATVRFDKQVLVCCELLEPTHHVTIVLYWLHSSQWLPETVAVTFLNGA